MIYLLTKLNHLRDPSPQKKEENTEKIMKIFGEVTIPTVNPLFWSLEYIG